MGIHSVDHTEEGRMTTDENKKLVAAAGCATPSACVNSRYDSALDRTEIMIVNARGVHLETLPLLGFRWLL
jgi:hypothetical protein